MLQKLTYAALTIALAGSIASCNKDNNNNNNSSFSNPKLQTLFEGLKSTPQIFNITAGRDTTIYGDLNTALFFYANSFKDGNGSIINSGVVQIELIETPRYQQMIANRVNTTTQNNERLISGGAIHIQASINSVTVNANNYGISYYQTDDNTSPMAIYYGYEDAALGGPTVQWYDDTTGTTTGRTKEIGNGTTGFYYTFDSVANFGWVNCDYFYSDPRPKTNIGVTLPDATFNDTNTEVMIVFPAINSASFLNNYLPNSRSYILGHQNYYLPIGETVHIMTIAEKNGKFYSDVQRNVNVTNNLTVNANLVEVTEAQIQAQVAGL